MDRSVDRITVDLKDCERTLPQLCNSRKLPTLNMRVLLVADFNDDGIEEVLVLITETSNKQRLAFFSLRENQDFFKNPLSSSSSNIINQTLQESTTTQQKPPTEDVLVLDDNGVAKDQTYNKQSAASSFVLSDSGMIVAPTYGVDGMIKNPKLASSSSSTATTTATTTTTAGDNLLDGNQNQQQQETAGSSIGRQLFSNSSSVAAGTSIQHIKALPRDKGIKMTEIRLLNLPLFDEEEENFKLAGDRPQQQQNDDNDSRALGADENQYRNTNSGNNNRRGENNYTIVDVHVVNFSESSCSSGGFVAASATSNSSNSTRLHHHHHAPNISPFSSSDFSPPNHHHAQPFSTFLSTPSRHQQHAGSNKNVSASAGMAPLSPGGNVNSSNNMMMKSSSSNNNSSSNRIGGLVVVLLEGLVVHIPARALVATPDKVQKVQINVGGSNTQNAAKRDDMTMHENSGSLNNIEDSSTIKTEEDLFLSRNNQQAPPPGTRIEQVLNVQMNQLEAIWQIPWNCCSSAVEGSNGIPHTVYCGFPCGLILCMPVGQHCKSLTTAATTASAVNQSNNNTMNSSSINNTVADSSGNRSPVNSVAMTQPGTPSASHNNLNNNNNVYNTSSSTLPLSTSVGNLPPMVTSSSATALSGGASASTSTQPPLQPANSQQNLPSLFNTNTSGSASPTKSITNPASPSEGETIANNIPQQENTATAENNNNNNIIKQQQEAPPRIIPASTYSSALTVGDSPFKIAPIFYSHDKQAVIIATRGNVVLVDKNCFARASFSQHLGNVQLLWALQVSCTNLETFQSSPTSTSWTIVTDQGNVFLFGIDNNGTISRCEFKIGFDIIQQQFHNHHHHHHQQQQRHSVSVSQPRFAKITMDKNEELCVIVVHENGSVTICDKARKSVHAAISTASGSTIRIQSSHQILGIIGGGSSGGGNNNNNSSPTNATSASSSSATALMSSNAAMIGKYHHNSSTTPDNYHRKSTTSGGNGDLHQPSGMLPFRSSNQSSMMMRTNTFNHHSGGPGSHNNNSNSNSIFTRSDSNIRSAELLLVDNCYIRHIVVDLPVQIHSSRTHTVNSWQKVTQAFFGNPAKNTAGISSVLPPSVSLCSFANSIVADRNLIDLIRQEKRLTQQQEEAMKLKKRNTPQRS